jgi:hypothetical protein
MSDVFVNKDRVPSSSHNATGEDEQGFFWPAGTRFCPASKATEKRYKKYCGDYANKVFLRQIGGEEVVVAMDEWFFKAHFVKEEPTLKLLGVEDCPIMGAVVIQ